MEENIKPAFLLEYTWKVIQTIREYGRELVNSKESSIKLAMQARQNDQHHEN